MPVAKDHNDVPKRYRLIACEIAFREFCHLVATARGIVDVDFLPKGLHDLETVEMRTRVQARIDAAEDAEYDAVLLGYGRCNDGVTGLSARSIPLVVPRAHDCITLFLGGKERYREYFDAHPGTYFHTSGWQERNFAREEGTVMQKLGLDKTYEQYVAEYGEENAQFIMETIGAWEVNYTRLAYIEMGVAEHLDYQKKGREHARQRGWDFDLVEGDLGLMRRLLDGEWDEEDFVIVPPGHQLIAAQDERVLEAAPIA